MNEHHAALPNLCATEQGIERTREIVLAIQAGSSAAFAELHAIYSRRLYKTIIAITESREDAEDALQETFLHAYLGMHAFEGRSTIYSWLTRIAINSALSILRKQHVRPEILFGRLPGGLTEAFCLELQNPSLNPERICDRRQRLAKAMLAMGNLDVRLREPLRMQIEKEASIAEISRALQITVAAVKTRLHRARRQLSARPDLDRFATNRRRLVRTPIASGATPSALNSLDMSQV